MQSYAQIRRNIVQAASEQTIPVLGEFEITKRCNMSCSMCYVYDGKNDLELTTKQWKKIFSDAVNEGLLFALLTGGEIFMRPDFEELYSMLYDAGVKITLYTNGTLINNQIVDILTKRPPEFVGITLYGTSNETYERVTKNKCGFDQVNRGIDLLIQNHINVALRTIPIQTIYEELDDIIRYAKHKNVPLGYSLYVGPTRDLCHKELKLRLSPAQLIQFEQKMTAQFSKSSNETFRFSRNGFTCAALRSGYFMTWNGLMQPCAMLSHPNVSVVVSTFKDAWNQLKNKLQEIDQCSDCHSCSLRSSCIQCYAKRYLEGSIHGCSSYLRAHAVLRKESNHEEL